jgi:hypothetical protein
VFHITIKITPTEASKLETSPTVWRNICGAYLTKKYGTWAYKIGQAVRVTNYKSVFCKGYSPNFTEEFFRIKEMDFGRPTVYELEDLKGNDVDGIFYEDELSPYSNAVPALAGVLLREAAAGIIVRDLNKCPIQLRRE